MNVYRLVTELTVEEKIVERQMIKLRMDKLIIQSGGVVGRKMKLSKNEK